MVCSECAILYIDTTTSSEKKFIIYRCFNSDAYQFWRELGKCSCKPVRQDYLDKVVDRVVVSFIGGSWYEIQREIEKRIEETKKAKPGGGVSKAAIEKQEILDSNRLTSCWMFTRKAL